MPKQTLPDSDAMRCAAQQLLRRGEITYAEAANLAGVSRQAARQWNIESTYESARQKHVEKLFHNAIKEQTK